MTDIDSQMSCCKISTKGHELTLLEAPHGDLGVQEIDPAHETHIREILDHVALS